MTELSVTFPGSVEASDRWLIRIHCADVAAKALPEAEVMLVVIHTDSTGPVPYWMYGHE